MAIIQVEEYAIHACNLVVNAGFLLTIVLLVCKDIYSSPLIDAS